MSNLTAPVTTTPAALHSDQQAQFEQWEECIAALDQALTDAAAARAAIDAESVTLERLEASAVLGIEGGNAETRKARLTLALADDARYQHHAQRLQDARQRHLDAERRVQVSKERCRLLRATLALAADHEG